MLSLLHIHEKSAMNGSFLKCRMHNKSVARLCRLVQPLFWLAISVLFLPKANAMTASPHSFLVQQFNETITLKINGDEFTHWITDTADFTVVRDDSGLYSYAELSDDGKLVPSNEKVGLSEPKPSSHHLHPKRKTDFDLNGDTDATSVKEAKSTRNCVPKCNCEHGQRSLRASSNKRSVSSQNTRRRTATVGTLKNLVILIKFRDHNLRMVPTREQINVLMNSEEIDPNFAPTGSLKMVYWENSYGQLTIDSFVTDWIRVSRQESYYAGGQSGVGSNRVFQEALVEALNNLERRGFDFSQFDQDKDFHIDCITFLTSGYGAEWGGAGFEDRIWSHQWNIDWTSARTGVRVTKYHVSPALWGISGSSIGRVGVIAHETGHFLGLEDHYDTDYSGNGLGFFCLMANSWGYDGSQLYPPHMSAYSKMKLSWTVPRTPVVGLNIVARSESPSTSRAPHHLYKIGDGQFGYPQGEYLLIEYRKTDWLRGGIAIYHIDESAPYNDEGFPGQMDANSVAWPYNGKHYKIALAPSDGNYELERGINQGNSFDLFSSGDYIIPSSAMLGRKKYPNTDTYQYGLVRRTGVELYAMSEPDRDFMTFVFWDGKAPGWSWLSNYFVKPPEANTAALPTQAPFAEEATGPTGPSNHSWRTIVSENFDGGPGAFLIGSAVKIEKKKCKSDGNCVKISQNKDTSTIRIQLEVTSLSHLQIAFDFYSDGLQNGEAIRLEHASVGSNNWNLARSWVMGEGGFVDKAWTSTAVIWQVNDSYDHSLQLQFRTTSEKRGFYIDSIVIKGR
ncbi:M6 family metalloprotease domain containing protein [Nitzschia inconspicua]|uniref:M6 family metalloprotease domain containing protein n=1 Tax=Nitzschia inconspicua TaxID=303405 RepID=A0A9K3LBE2_9STRA|nr:M6 family metalloprotease domain containing protein [Nitzschia inconspicua]